MPGFFPIPESGPAESPPSLNIPDELLIRLRSRKNKKTWLFAISVEVSRSLSHCSGEAKNQRILLTSQDVSKAIFYKRGAIYIPPRLMRYTVLFHECPCYQTPDKADYPEI